MPSKDELLLVIEVTSTTIRAGLGVHDWIRAPSVVLPTRIARKRAAGLPFAQEDYVVGRTAEDAELELVETFANGPNGMEVLDWPAFEALLRHILHVVLRLPRPPLSHPVLLGVPTDLPDSTLDEIHLLMFERLLVPQLLVVPRAFLASFASGQPTAVVLDIGARGEGSSVNCVVEHRIVDSAAERAPLLDEGVLDDWAAVQIVTENPALLETLLSSGAPPRQTMKTILDTLKDQQEIKFASEVVHVPDASSGKKRKLNLSAVLGMDSAGNGVAPMEEDSNEGVLDVGKLLAEGNMDAIVGKGKKAAEVLEDGTLEGDYVSIPNPLDVEAEALLIGPARHRYLEPLFAPELLATLKPSTNAVARSLGLDEYEHREVPTAGIQEYLGLSAGGLTDTEAKAVIWENVVVISTGKAGRLKSLGTTLLPLLAPFVADQDSGSESQPKFVKHARVPDYFSEYKEAQGETAVFLGGCIMAKLALADSASHFFVTKSDYSTAGPAYHRLLESLQ